MASISGPYRDYAEGANQYADDTEGQLVGLGIRPEEVRRYVTSNASSAESSMTDQGVSKRNIFAAFKR